MNNKIIVGVVVGLVIGLALGIFVSAFFNLPSKIGITQTGVGTNNQVQVSGTVNGSYSNLYALYFQNVNQSILTSAPIVNGQYSVLLIGGQSYNIYGYNPTPDEGKRLCNSRF